MSTEGGGCRVSLPIYQRWQSASLPDAAEIHIRGEDQQDAPALDGGDHALTDAGQPAVPVVATWHIRSQIRWICSRFLHVSRSCGIHRSKKTRAFLVSTSIMQSIRCSSSHSAKVDRKEGASKHDKNTVTLRMRALKVFLLLCCGAQATLRYSWCNPPHTGTEMIRSPR